MGVKITDVTPKGYGPNEDASARIKARNTAFALYCGGTVFQ